MARRLLKEHIKTLFAATKSSSYWDKVKKLPVVLRYILWASFMLFWLLGIIAPILPGAVFVIIGLALIIGLRRARSWTIRLIHFTRLHLLYSKIYMWWQMYKKKNLPR